MADVALQSGDRQAPMGSMGGRIAAAALLWAAVSVAADPVERTTVGIEGRVVWRYGGAAVRPIPADDRAPVVVRIADQSPDGGQTLYDLRFIAQKAGEYDLRTSLEHLDGAPVTDGDPMPVQVGALLPADHGGDLFDIASGNAPILGGYRLALVAIGIIWLSPLVYLVVKRLRRPRQPAPVVVAGPPTLADQLRPLVEGAIAGDLSIAGHARLEMLLLAYWRERLDLSTAPHAEALSHLRGHPEAGTLILQLEHWLHRPVRDGDARVDVGTLLGPYRNAAPVLEQAPVESSA